LQAGNVRPKKLGTPEPMIKNLLIILSLLALSACGSEPIGRKFEFDDSKDYALLAYDITFIGEPFPNFSFYLFPYDAATGTINDRERVEMGCGYVCARGNEEVRFYMKALNPGPYVVGFLSYQADFNRTILCYAPQSLLVEAEAGTILYMGELNISLDHPAGLVMDKLEVIPHDETHVRRRLAKFPNVLEVNEMVRTDGTYRTVRNTANPGEIRVLPVNYVAFDRGAVQKEGVCIRDYDS
jgi:hypothetical protein